MAWFQETIILLPQFPQRFGEEGFGAVFALQKPTILRFLEGKQLKELDLERIPFDDGGIHKQIAGFEGFEAIAFEGTNVYLTIEASPRNEMKGFIVSGIIQPDRSRIVLHPETLAEIPLQESIKNFSDEALIIYDRKVITFYEANGTKANPFPFADCFNLSLDLSERLIFPNLEYRITDASLPDHEGFFWAINTYFPADEWKLRPQSDILADRYGEGKTHSENFTVERLVKLQIQDNAIRIVDEPPIQLQLEGDLAPRNWEAIAPLDNKGFLLATDKFPRTIFGFVPFETSP